MRRPIPGVAAAMSGSIPTGKVWPRARDRQDRCAPPGGGGLAASLEGCRARRVDARAVETKKTARDRTKKLSVGERLQSPGA